MMLPDFQSFYRALHSDDVDQREAYRWQCRAAVELAERGFWPAVKAPTGAGKTTLGEIWLWAMAASEGRCSGRRLFWVVDRRAVIDQVYEHMAAVVESLVRSGHPDVIAVRERLREIAGGETDPKALLWRGGVDDAASDDRRTRLDPKAVAIICSTVDQVGSRLLFRGYGTRPSSRAMHAGLAGIDSVILLDEAHISKPFLATIEAIAERQGAEHVGQSEMLPQPLNCVAVTATQETGPGSFVLNTDERRELAKATGSRAPKEVILERRMSAAKIAGLAIKSGTSVADDSQPARVAGLVMNTVAEARAVFSALHAQGVEESDTTLIIGPVRPLDRVATLSCIPTRQQRASRGRPFFVVATQTIEVGVDLDFDFLITACAPLPSLIQRAGRLNRKGVLPNSTLHVIQPAKKCPVYGDDSLQAWRWLQDVDKADGRLDFSPEELARLEKLRPWPVPEPTTDEQAPVLQDSHVRALAAIDGRPEEGPDIELFLHGMRPIDPQVSIFWRADLGGAAAEELRRPQPYWHDPAPVAEQVALRPPHSGEILTVSLTAAERWLNAKPTAVVADVPANDAASDEASSQLDNPIRPHAYRLAWVGRRGLAAEEFSGRLRPGDLIVVDSRSGGCDHYGWNPGGGPRYVPDLGSLSPARPRVLLPLVSVNHAEDLNATVRDAEANLLDMSEVPAEMVMAAKTRMYVEAGLFGRSDPARGETTAAKAIQERRAERYQKRIEEIAERLREGRYDILEGFDGQTGPRQVLLQASGTSEMPTRPAGRKVGELLTLDEHRDEVGRNALRNAQVCGVADEVGAYLQTAGHCHDEGKRDIRFQAWLSGGEPVAAPLAKSTWQWTPRRSRELREAAGWPAGQRHETLGAAAVLAKDPSRDLTAWLVATHHGRYRPFPPDNGAPHTGYSETISVNLGDMGDIDIPGSAELDLGWLLETFERLSREYGAWGLAYLEALLIAADHEASAGKE